MTSRLGEAVTRLLYDGLNHAALHDGAARGTMTTMSTYQEATQRLATDREFRAEIMQNTDAALSQYNLSSDDRDRLLQEAEMMEAEVQTDPMESTAADEGEADAAGSKN